MTFDQVDLKRLENDFDITELEVRRAFEQWPPEDRELDRRVADAQTREELDELLNDVNLPHKVRIYALHRLLALSETPSEVDEILIKYHLELGDEEIADFVHKAARQLSSLLSDEIERAADTETVFTLWEATPSGSIIANQALRKLASFYPKQG
jgi:hypothetical protein